MLRRTSFLKNRKGLAAVEFALIAPVMIIMFYGSVELSSAIDCNERVSRVTATVADLVAQETAISSADTSNVFSAANAILFPYPSGSAHIVVSSLVTDASGKAKVDWSEAQNASKRTSPPANIPAGILPASSSVIYAEVTYAFTPAISYFVGNVNLTSAFYSKPRRSAKVTHS